ncbi:MAG: MBL fold metallo-hydrolase [Candidatus Aminicenantes bacterium]|nr:MBL fold metallo-hydrolase [Candidatus Aminicenantes bacterium]
MKIVFLGTGGAVPTAARDNTSFLLQSGPELWLVDCPGSLTQKILKTNRRPQQVSAIFISHIHADHLYGLPAFIHSLMLEEKTVPLYGSPETIDFCLRLIDLFGLRREKILYRLEPRPLLPGCRTEVSPGLAVTGWPVPHHSSSLAFILETAEARVVYSGDTPLHRPLLEQAARADCLIHDCSTPSRYLEGLPFLRSLHSNSLELGQAALETGIRLLVPCHFFSDLDFSLEEIEAEIRKNYQGQLFLPTDFSELELPL